MRSAGVLQTRLGRRLLLVFLVTTFLPLVGFAGFSSWQVKHEVRQQAEAALHGAAKTSAMGLAARCSQLAANLGLLQASGCAALGGEADNTAEQVFELLRPRCTAAWIYAGEDGQRLFGDGVAPERPRSEAALTHLATGRPLVVATRESVQVWQRIGGDGDRPAWLMVAARPEGFWDADELRANGAEVLVYDGAMQPLFHTLGSTPDATALTAVVAASPASGSVSWQVAGVPHLARYWRAFLRPQYGLDLLVVQTRPVEEALAAASGFADTFYGSAALALCLVLGAAMAQLRRILGPVVDLEAATRRVAAGDFAVRVGAIPDDELGALGVAFDRMTAQLGESLRQREQVERELAASRDAALAAANAKAAFVTNVSHELRTPMAEILGATEVLAEHAGDDPATRIEFARIARTGAERLARLVDDVLDFGSTTPWAMLEVDVVATIQAALAELPAAQRGRIEAALPEGRVQVRGAADRLVDAWRRLLHNAIKFSAPEAPIALRAGVEGGVLCIEIEDRGVGISRLDLPHVFEPFCQFGRDQLTDKAPGTGLGLAIVRRTVEGHGGSIEVESELGNGATFRVRLPLARAVVAEPAAT